MVKLFFNGFRPWASRNRSNLITALLLALAVSSSALFWIHNQPARVKHQLQASRQVLLDAVTSLSQVPEPKTIQPGQEGGKTNYQVQSISEFNPPPAALTSALAHVSSTQINHTYGQAESDLQKAKKLLDYHRDVMTSLQKTLEYNPTLDFKKFALATADTQKRLSLAQNGLSQTMAKLQGLAGHYDDPGLTDLLTIISNLQSARDKLAKDSNVPAWTAAFAAAQQAIIANRQSFWQPRAQDISQDLLAANSQLTHYQTVIR